MKEANTQRMRVYHRYLGFFLAGIMAMYAISGITLIFRDTNFLKVEKMHEKTLAPNLPIEAVGKELRIRDINVEKEEGDVITFRKGTYNKSTGMTVFFTMELPWFLDRITNIHKAETKDPLFFLNIFFGLSLLFFVISAFWMFLPSTSVFKKGLYFALGGVLLTLLLIFI